MKRSVGMDIVEVRRFRILAQNKHASFLQKSFSKRELEYCFAYKDPAPHLAGVFAAKEAAAKAFGAEKFPFIEFEIRRTKHGIPEVWRRGKRLSIAISITHSRTMAAAVAVR